MTTITRTSRVVLSLLAFFATIALARAQATEIEQEFQQLVQKLDQWQQQIQPLLTDKNLRPLGKVIDEARNAKTLDEQQRLSAEISQIVAACRDAEQVAKPEDQKYLQMLIGYAYIENIGIPYNSAEAARWFSKAADQNFPEAQYILGKMYIEGAGVPKNTSKGVQLIQDAANQNFAVAQYVLGRMLQEGTIVPANKEAAFYWLLKAARQAPIADDNTIANAQAKTAMCYLCGDGVAKNINEGISWMQKAAEQGLPEAQGMMGALYSTEGDIPIDYTKAMYWYKKAAAQNNAIAQYYLGRMYYYGLGVPKDKAEAIKWLQKSADQKYEEAQAALADLLNEK